MNACWVGCGAGMNHAGSSRARRGPGWDRAAMGWEITNAATRGAGRSTRRHEALC